MKYLCRPYFANLPVDHCEPEEIDHFSAFLAAQEYAEDGLSDAPDNGTQVISVVDPDGVVSYYDAIFRTITVSSVRQVSAQQANEPTYQRDTSYSQEED